MGKSTQFKQQTNDYDDNNNNNNNESSKAAQLAAAESASDDDNCFLNPTLAAFNFGNLFYCNFCGFSANNTNKILHHLFIHVFKCSSCSHFTYTKYDLMKHIYKYHRPNKELKIKRLVLEVTSNDWYFLCSENEPHNLTSAINDDNDTGGACFYVNNDYRSIDKSASSHPSHHQQHTRLVQSNQSFDQNEFITTSSKGKKPATNFFLPKVQKSPEKLTQVIQSNRQYTTTYSETDHLSTSNTSDNSVPGSNTMTTTTGNSQLKKLMSNNKDSNPTSKIIIPTIKMMNSQQTSSTTTIISSNNNKQSSISSIMNSPVYNTSNTTNNSNNKLMDYMETTTTAAATNPVPSLVSGKPKRQIRKPISIQDKTQAPKVIKKPKKYTDDSMFSSETKKDLESIKNKYTNLKCKYTCKQCDFEVDDAFTAYSHVIKTNDSHFIKCCACDAYSNDNVCSYKMHLLSKHKFYASADKLFHEFFSIINLETEEKILLDSPLSTHVASAIASAKANEASGASSGIKQITTGGHDGLYINISPKTHHSNYDDEKITTLKRALIDANIIISPSGGDSNESSSNRQQQQLAQNKKMRFIVDDGSNSDHKGAISNDDENSQHQKCGGLMDSSGGNGGGYDIEVLDDGSTIYICAKCKLVFLKTNLLLDHKCFTSNSSEDLSSYQQNLLNEGGNDVSKEFKRYSSSDDHHDSKNTGNDSCSNQLLSNDDINNNTKEMMMNRSNQNDDYDMMKNNSDIIYIE